MESCGLDLEQAVEQLNGLMQRKRLDSAKTLLAKTLPQYPDNIDLLAFAVWIDWQEDNHSAAKSTIEQILGTEPRHYFARYILALILEEEENYPASEHELLGLLKDYPEDAELYAVYARVMLATFNFDKAERLANEALRREPENETALNASAISAFVNAPGAETQERLHRLIKEHPDQIQTTCRLIQVLVDQGKTREAYVLARELVQLQPDNLDIVELATELKMVTHWSLKPLWPMRRFGWGGSIAIWFAAVLILRSELLNSLGIGHLIGPITWLFISYVVYSWVWPPLLRRMIK